MSNYRTQFLVSFVAYISIIALVVVGFMIRFQLYDKIHQAKLSGLAPDPNLYRWINLLEPLNNFSIALASISTLLLIWSGIALAKSKGYSWWIGLLSLINIVGLAIIILLPNKLKK